MNAPGPSIKNDQSPEVCENLPTCERVQCVLVSDNGVIAVYVEIWGTVGLCLRHSCQATPAHEEQFHIR
ncbi:hypothetical protein M5D96_010193 [Drosophila gunungcola]|uniref:Uncharacterized protein n=1 Tax=Drosophila gunungcola TaxID=103775 RepID=A0A9P9YH86_9MUSC|nr:hypothetical protein M5D96_010193 [Drosophila gunungcola]